jgi:SAM-dependent methyltransferase
VLTGATVNLEQIRTWYETVAKSEIADGDALEAWHVLSPQCRFLKALPGHAAVLDVGAGDGALQVYRTWPPPKRSDLMMYAFAMDRGSMFDRYDGHELGMWLAAKPNFGGKRFDAIFAANFIEHIDGPSDFIHWGAARLAPGGRIFLEWPRETSLSLPTTADLLAIGIDVMAGNYFDDSTHRAELPTAPAVQAALIAAGLQIEATGIVQTPWLQDHLMAIGKLTNDRVHRTFWPIGRSPHGAGTSSRRGWAMIRGCLAQGPPLSPP